MPTCQLEDIVCDNTALHALKDVVSSYLFMQQYLSSLACSHYYVVHGGGI